MCGISAVVDFGDEGDMSVVARMDAALTHRGPDGAAYLAVTPAFAARETPAPRATGPLRLAMSFRWLAVQDLDPVARAPIALASNRVFGALNGEIYNFCALGSELRNGGVRFRTAGDTEVALASYAAWGADAFRRWNGMWAMLIVDLERRTLIGTRDRLGVKPLFYARDGRRWLFGSEPAAVARGLSGGPAPDQVSFHAFLGGRLPSAAQRTFFEGVRPMPAGTWFELPLDRPTEALEFRRYWSLARQREAGPAPSFRGAVDELESLVVEAVELQARAAVRVGALLSGGLDSSLLARLLGDLAGRSTSGAPATVSIVYEDPALSERTFAEAVLAQGGLDGHFLQLTQDDLWSAADAVIATQGQPLFGFELAAQYLAYKKAREVGCIVVLDGQGADELLGGVPLYEVQQFLDDLFRGRFLHLAGAVRAGARRDETSIPNALRRFVLMPLARRMRGRRPDPNWLLPREDDGDVDAPAEASCDTDRLNRFLFDVVRQGNLPAVLGFQDRSSMAHGVESRVPFLDHRIVELCFRLPAEFKVHAAVRKRVLVEVGKRHLPPCVVARKDKGTFVRDVDWLDLRRREVPILDTLLAPTLAKHLLVDGRRVGELARGFFARRHDDQRTLWRLYTSARWLEQQGLR